MGDNWIIRLDVEEVLEHLTSTFGQVFGSHILEILPRLAMHGQSFLSDRVLGQVVPVELVDLLAVLEQQSGNLDWLVVLEPVGLRVQDVEVLRIALFNGLEPRLDLFFLLLLHELWHHAPGQLLLLTCPHIHLRCEISNLRFLADRHLLWIALLLFQLLGLLTECFLRLLSDDVILLFLDLGLRFLLEAELLQALWLALDPLGLQLLLLLRDNGLLLLELLHISL